jgi:hypothetical protein
MLLSTRLMALFPPAVFRLSHTSGDKQMKIAQNLAWG